MNPGEAFEKLITSLTGGNNTFFALLYAKDEVKDVMTDTIIFVIEAPNAEVAKSRVEAHFTHSGIQGFSYKKHVWLSQQTNTVFVQPVNLEDSGSTANIQYAVPPIAPQKTADVPQFYKLPPTKEEYQGKFIWNIRFLLDAVEATPNERKVAENLIQRFESKENVSEDVSGK